MGLRSNSRRRRRHKMATDLSPRRGSRVKGQGPEELDAGRSQGCRSAPPVAAAASLNLVQGTSEGKGTQFGGGLRKMLSPLAPARRRSGSLRNPFSGPRRTFLARRGAAR